MSITMYKFHSAYLAVRPKCIYVRPSLKYSQENNVLNKSYAQDIVLRVTQCFTEFPGFDVISNNYACAIEGATVVQQHGQCPLD
jgi:hypothetical protein